MRPKKPIRAKLTVVPRKRSDGTSFYAARGFVPICQADGTIAYERRQHSLADGTAAARKAETDRLNAVYEEDASRLFRPVTFAIALSNYIDAGHPLPLYAEKLIARLGQRPCIEIDDSAILAAKKAMFAADAAPSYVNRHLYTPVIAALTMALRERAPRLTRPKGHKERSERTNIEIPPDSWYPTVSAKMGASTCALTYFLTLHGRRLGDGLGRRPRDFDPARGTIEIGRTKNGEPLLVTLHPRLVPMILEMPGWRSRKWLFGNGPNAASNFRRDVRSACELAGVDYYSPHEFGRHAFATRMLRAGYSLQYVKDAGGWKTIEVLSKLYGHLERAEWVEGVHRVGDSTLSTGNKVEILPPPLGGPDIE
jgi:integrase